MNIKFRLMFICKTFVFVFSASESFVFYIRNTFCSSLKVFRKYTTYKTICENVSTQTSRNKKINKTITDIKAHIVFHTSPPL